MEGWRQVFIHTGHEWRWLKKDEAILDVFNEYKPDMFIGATYEINSALKKALIKYPETIVLMKANNWGPSDKDIDKELFPIGKVDEKEIKKVEELLYIKGLPLYLFNFYHLNRYKYTMSYWELELGLPLIEGLPAADTFNYKPVEPREELKCDVGFVGGYWPYKARNLDKYIFPLCFPVGKYDVKIFGNQVWPVPQYLGNASNATTEALFASSTICPNISEPHANEFGFEVNERVFKLAASKAFCINDPIASLSEDIFTNNELVIADDDKHFQDLVHMFISNPQLRDKYIEAAHETVMKSHTYAHRVANMWKVLGNKEEEQKCLDLI
jgi:hypothetical protein